MSGFGGSFASTPWPPWPVSTSSRCPTQPLHRKTGTGCSPRDTPVEGSAPFHSGSFWPKTVGERADRMYATATLASLLASLVTQVNSCIMNARKVVELLILNMIILTWVLALLLSRCICAFDLEIRPSIRDATLRVGLVIVCHRQITWSNDASGVVRLKGETKHCRSTCTQSGSTLLVLGTL